MKKLLTILMLLAASLPLWAEEFKVDGISYYTIGEGTVVVTSGGSYSGDIVIPSTVTYNGTTFSVTEIGGGAFYGCTGLTSITIPNSVTSIGYYAFDGCTGLTSITIPNSVTSIGEQAFSGCKFSNIYFDDIATICNGVWSALPHASAVNLYLNGELITELVIPDGITTIGNYAFQNCTGLTSITIPNSVTSISIGYNAFDNCTSLKVVKIEDGDEALSLGYNFSEGLFYDCPLESLYLGRNLSYEEGKSPFYKNKTLKEITIGNSVTSIGVDAFQYCTGLTKVTIPNSVTSIGNGAFSGCTGLTTVTIPNSVTSIGNSAFSSCTGLTSITIPNSVTSIGNYAFKGCTGLTSITIPNSVTEISYDAFRQCTSLKEVKIEDGDETLSLGSNDYSLGLFYDSPIESLYLGRNLSYEEGRSPFYNNETLKEITIGNSVTSIGEQAFTVCTRLTDVTIGNGVTSIGINAFLFCHRLTGVYISDLSAWCRIKFDDSNSNPLSYARNLYINNELVTSLVIPDDVTSIGNSAFSSCTGLTSITIPNSVTSIGNYAFDGCTSLKEVKIEDGDETLSLGYNYYNSGGTGEGLFYDCPLETLYLGRNLSYEEGYQYGYTPFYNIKTLKEITIGNSVTSIGSRAFAYCTSLKKLDISENIQSLGDNYLYGNQQDLTIVMHSLNPPMHVDPYKGFDKSGWTLKIYEEALPLYKEKGWIGDYKLSHFNFEFDGICYEAISNSQVKVISNANKYSGAVIIPSTVEYDGTTYSVTSIGSSAFAWCDGLTEVTIPNSVTSIGSSAFAWCDGLTEVTIPNSVTSIGIGAFYDCSGLTSITLGNSVTSIGEEAFYDCSGLTSITIPNSVTSIGEQAFSDCTGLTSITIPNSVTSIGEYAFSNCTGLTRLDISENIESLGKNYLYGNKQDLTIVMRSLNPPMHVNPYEGFDKSEWKLIIPSEEVLSLYREKGWIGEYEIIYMGEFEPFKFEAGGICYKAISNSEVRVISNANKYSGAVIIPSTVEYDGTTYSVIEIDESAFKYCTELTSVTIPNSVTSIGEQAFSDCYGLTSITIPNSVTSIGYRAFDGCIGLTSVTIPNSVTSIGEQAFSGCTRLTSITIPNSVTSIGIYAFGNCTSLKEVKMEDGNATLSLGYNLYNNWETGEGLFYDCPLESLYLGRNLSYRESVDYGYSPFYNIKTLKEITIGNSVTSIGKYAFSHCTRLTSINLPNSVTSIGEQAFANCTSLKTLDISENIESLGSDYLYGNQQDLTIVMHSLNPPMHVNPYEGFDKSGWTLRIPYEEVLPLYKEKGWIGEYKLSYFDFEADGIRYRAISNSKVRVISNVNEYSGAVVIPSTVEYDGTTYSVISIGKQAFSDCTGLTSITIPNSVTSIGEQAFSDCTGLTSITIPNSVTSIGEQAFSYCTGLTEITIPNSVTSIGNSAFDNCTSLKEVKIEEGDATLSLGYNYYSRYSGEAGQGLFYDCPLESLYLGRNISYNAGKAYGYSPFGNINTLKEITIGNSVTSIGEEAFYGCTELTNITISNSVTSIGRDALPSCTISNIYFDDIAAICNGIWSALPRASAVNLYHNGELVTELVIPDSIASLGNNAFQNCTGLTSVTIPNSVTSIGKSAFQNCTGLTSITIPNSVTSIGIYAFYNCTSIKEVKMEDGDATLSLGYNFYNNWETGEGLFYDCPLETLYLGRNISYDAGKNDGYSPFGNINTLKEITIGNSVTSIGNYAFYGCTGLTSITIPNSVTSIGNYAFDNCTSLKEVKIEDGDATLSLGYNYYTSKEIGQGLFNDCPLESLYLGRNLSYRESEDSGFSPFYNIKTLKEITIGNSVTSIGNYAFSSCSGLTEVTIPNSVTSIGSSAFSSCSGLTEVTIPNSVTSIGSSAFSGCSGLSTVNFNAESCSTMGTTEGPVFADCTNFTKLNIGESVQTIPARAFRDCTGLTKVTIPNSVTSIGGDAFYGCTGLTSITIPNSVTSIGGEAFSGCTGLTSITIPNSVTSIGIFAFWNCTGLTSVTIGSNVSNMEYTFRGCSNISVINAHPTTPPAINSYTFMDSVKQSAILNVPSLSAYTTADVWKDFADIREFAIEGYYDFEADGIYYRIVSLGDKTVEVVAKDDNYNSYSGDVVIPEIIFFKNNNFTVVAIGQAAFHNCNELLSLTIPQHIEEIKAGALSGCSGLKTLTIADSDKTLKTNQNFKGLSIESLYLGRDYEGNFSACVSLQNVEISNKVTTLQEYTFDGCTSLTQLVIPASVSEIKDNACSNSEISKLIIEAKNVILSNIAFSNCPLTHIYLKETIKDGSFDGYKNLKTVVIGGDLDDAKKHDDTFINCNIDELIIDCEKVYCLFSNCNISKLHFSNNLSEWFNDGFDNRNDFIEISFGNDVTTVHPSGSSNLKTVKFGNKVECILANFGNSLEAMSVYSYNTTPPVLEYAFANKTYMQGTLYVPKGCKDVYLAADRWKDFWNVEEISSITDNNLSYNLLEDNTLALIPDATGGIYSGQVVIPATVEVDGEVYKVSRIEANTFDNAYGVTSVIIEDSKEPLTIGEREEEITDNNYRVLLSDCMLDSVYVGRELAYQIKELETPEYVLYNNSPFTNNAYLSKVTVGPEVATMGGAMFYGCRNIRNVYATGMIPPLEAEFETQVYEKATLTIPKGTLEAYTTTAGWEEFLNIVEEKAFSDIIENVNQPNTPVVVVSNGELTVMNGNAQDIAIYNMSGNLIYRGVNRPVRIDIHGVYIVVVDGFATKVII